MMPVISVLGKTWKQRSKEVEEMGIRRGNGMMFLPSIPILEWELYTEHTALVGSSDQYLREATRYEESIQKSSGLILVSESASQATRSVQNNSALSERRK